MTTEEQHFIRIHHCTLLLSMGKHSLYNTPIGAHTIADAMAIMDLHARYRAAISQSRQPVWDNLVSTECFATDEHCIDNYGCGLG